ncbi:MAG: nucleotidyltransferase domain-containing protein [Candidatus Aenigmarchaeota archaeon]|nr:nucleotidyltransferase domain-containing protein [Candidatus Aenigmarchaeota archaeon]
MFTELNILKSFFEEPTREFGVREIARIKGISPATASKELKDLAKSGILKRHKERTATLYRADMENDLYKDLKVFYNVRKIRESGLLETLNSFYLKPAVVLFGSAAFGMDTETSDFDLLVVSEKTKELKDLKIFEAKIKREIQVFVVNEIKDLRNGHLINSVLNGIVIQGRIKWI